jgi:perosamine synthetase
MWNREFLQNKNEYVELFDEVMRIDNECGIEFLENKVANIADRKYAVAVNSATDALYYSLLCYGIGPGDEVLVSDFSWISTASCVNMTRATPIFCDIDLDSYHISFDEIKKKYNRNTKALIYTHLFGNMTNTQEIEEFCRVRNIAFIEDAAQSIGSSLNGRPAGSIGNVSSYSFNNNKVISGISGGGMFMTDEEDKAEHVKKLRNHGKNEDFEMLGYNSKMSYINAAFIDFRLDKMHEWQLRRQDISKKYNENFLDLPVYVQTDKNGLNNNRHKYTIRFETKNLRDTIKYKLKAPVHYNIPISENKMYTICNNHNAKMVSDTILTLPNNAFMTDEEVENVCMIVDMCIV